MTYPVTLGGLVFELPSLPWRKVQTLQPALIAWTRAHDFGASGDGFVALAADDLSALADLVFEAVQCSPQGRATTREAFDDLPISALQMAAAVEPILRACGLRMAKRGEGADPKA